MKIKRKEAIYHCGRYGVPLTLLTKSMVLVGRETKDYKWWRFKQLFN
jgi:hypothetical protein